MSYSALISPEFTVEFNALRSVCVQFLSGEERILNEEHELNYDELYQLARRHRVQRLLPPLKTVSDQAGSMTRKGLQDAKRGLNSIAELAILHSLFDKNNIPFLVLKGPAIGVMVYGDPTLRPARDLDLLVRPSEVEAVHQMLEAEGFERLFPSFKLTPKQHSFFTKEHNQSVYVHPDRNVRLEVHWRLFREANILIEEQTLFENPYTFEVASRKFNTLSPSVQFNYLCIHGAGHAWSSLNWLLDVCLLIERYDEDWESLFHASAKQGLQRPIAQMYLLRELVFGITAPTYITELYIRDRHLKRMVEFALERLGKPDSENLKRSVSNLLAQMNYRSAIGMGNGLKFSRLSWFTIRDFELLSLPDALFFLYLPLRPFLWCWRYIGNRRLS